MGKTSNLYKNLPPSLQKVAMALLPQKYANLFQCSKEGLWDPYFVQAEAHMESQWAEIIWPLIKDFDFSVVLELAPGAGRNTEKLSACAKKIHAIDYNVYALEKCRERLGPSFNGCEIEYHLNNGTELSMIAGDAVSAVYCWDAAVHFDKKILEGYAAEFARVLRPGGKGFIHHSNLGSKARKNLNENPHLRSNMDKRLFAAICERNDLKVLSQTDIPWGEITDCATVFEKALLR